LQARQLLLLLSSYVVLLKLPLERFHSILDRTGLDAARRVPDRGGILGLARTACDELGLEIGERCGIGLVRRKSGGSRDQRPRDCGVLGERERCGTEPFDCRLGVGVDDREREQTLLVARHRIEADAPRRGNRIT
jgi:hypothetical protein